MYIVVVDSLTMKNDPFTTFLTVVDGYFFLVTGEMDYKLSLLMLENR
jgi:hypothetical protein